jgi:hypothetical protein
MNFGLLKRPHGAEKREFENECAAAGNLFEAYRKGGMGMEVLANLIIKETPKITEALAMFDAKSHDAAEGGSHYHEHQTAFRLLVQYGFLDDSNSYKLVLTGEGSKLLDRISEERKKMNSQMGSNMLR